MGFAADGERIPDPLAVTHAYARTNPRPRVRFSGSGTSSHCCLFFPGSKFVGCTAFLAPTSPCSTCFAPPLFTTRVGALSAAAHVVTAIANTNEIASRFI